MSNKALELNPSFDYDKHLLEVCQKYKQFVKDFELEDYIELMHNKGIQNCTECHYRPNEPKLHRHAKNKLFRMFLHNNHYLVETEVKAKKNKGELEVFNVGKRGYSLDVLVINVKNLIKLFNHVDKVKTLSNYKLISMEHDVMFALEVDGDIHSWKKDKLRDLFFLEEYNIVTVRYDVSDVIKFHKKYRGKRQLSRHIQNFTQDVEMMDFNELSVDRILLDAKALYYKKYKNLRLIQT